MLPCPRLRHGCREEPSRRSSRCHCREVLHQYTRACSEDSSHSGVPIRRRLPGVMSLSTVVCISTRAPNARSRWPSLPLYHDRPLSFDQPFSPRALSPSQGVVPANCSRSPMTTSRAEVGSRDRQMDRHAAAQHLMTRAHTRTRTHITALTRAWHPAAEDLSGAC